jgi:hypothetical protein
MTLRQIRLDPRIVGATHPPTVITLSDDGVGIDPSIYAWTIEAASPGTPGTAVWTKTTGIATSSTAITITWAALDLGALTAGPWVLDLNGTSGANVRKVRMEIQIAAQVG